MLPKNLIERLIKKCSNKINYKIIQTNKKRVKLLFNRTLPQKCTKISFNKAELAYEPATRF